MFVVPMVHSTVLINLKHSQTNALSYTPPPSYKGDDDDMLIFAYTAREAGTCRTNDWVDSNLHTCCMQRGRI